MLFLILQAVTWPFERFSHNVLKCVELFALVLCFLIVLVIQLERRDNPCAELVKGTNVRLRLSICGILR